MFRFRTLSILVASALALLPFGEAEAGLININLTDTTVTGTGMDGDAILGGGAWNQIRWMDAGLDNALVDSASAATGITAKDAGAPFGAPQTNGNPVQSEAWGTPVDLTVSGLIANQIYKVAVYSDRVGTSGPDDDIYTVNGGAKPLPKSGAAVTVLPGVENVDYAIFIVFSSGAGEINVMAPWIAGIQIEGILPGEDGPQPDARISAKSSQAGKGDGIYASVPRKSQTLTQETKRKRPRRFYARVENDGKEADQFYLTGWWQKRKSNVKVIDLTGGGNVTAAAFAQNYRYQLCENEFRRFKIIVKPKKKKPGKLKARFGASPSTQASNRKDLVVTVTKVRP